MSDPAFAVWLTGLPSCGKSTIAAALVRRLRPYGMEPAVLESDTLRRVLTPAPDYSAEERDRFYAAIAHIGSLLAAHGVPVIFDATANRRNYRDAARAAIKNFVEVYVDCPREVCAQRDVKGIYAAAALGRATTVPGLQVPYEPPASPDLVVAGVSGSPDEAAAAIVSLLERRRLLGRVEPAPNGAVAGTDGAAGLVAVTDSQQLANTGQASARDRRP